MAITNTRRILQLIGDSRLALYKGEGYWYFAFEEASTGKYDTRSVYVFYLNHMTTERWVEEGRAFIADMDAREAPGKPTTMPIRLGFVR